MNIYPTLPAHATKDFYEMTEPLSIVELNCTCNPDNAKVCQSCKQYFKDRNENN